MAAVGCFARLTSAAFVALCGFQTFALSMPHFSSPTSQVHRPCEESTSQVAQTPSKAPFPEDKTRRKLAYAPKLAPQFDGLFCFETFVAARKWRDTLQIWYRSVIVILFLVCWTHSLKKLYTCQFRRSLLSCLSRPLLNSHVSSLHHTFSMPSCSQSIKKIFNTRTKLSAQRDLCN